MPTNQNRRELLRRVRETGYPGSITEVFQASDQGIDLISQFQAEQDQQQQQMQVAQTQQQQEVGLREEHARGNTQASMAFPDVQPNQSFNTVGMEAPIDIQKVNDQGHLVESYKNVPPGIQDLPTGPYEGTIIESPAAYQKGGVKRIIQDLKTISPEGKDKLDHPVLDEDAKVYMHSGAGQELVWWKENLKRKIKSGYADVKHYYDAYVKGNKKKLEEIKKYRKTNPVPNWLLKSPFAVSMLSPLKAGRGSNVIDPETGVNKYTGKKEYTPYQKGGFGKDEEIYDAGLLPEVEVSALKDKSYNKLSDSQKQVYDSFVTPGGTAQTVNIGGDREMHWKNALQMVKDIDVNISNVPEKNIFGYDTQKVHKEGANKGYFRPHAQLGSLGLRKKIHVPAHQVYKDQQALFQERAKKRGLEYSQFSDIDAENLARKNYFSNIIAETAHIPEFYRKESFKNIPITMARRLYRSIKGDSDKMGNRSNYQDPHDYEYKTHTGPDSFEEKLRSKYEIKQKGGFNLGAELSPEIVPGNFCGSVTGCGQGRSPFSAIPSIEASYNTNSKNINTGYGGGIGFNTSPSSGGFESIVSYKRRNAFDTQGDDAVTPIGKGTNNISLSLGKGRRGRSSNVSWRSDSAPYRYGINAEYDLTNKKLSNIGLYGRYGKFKGSLGYSPATKGVNMGVGFKFQEGGRRLYKKGGPEIPEAPVPAAVPVPITVSPAELFQYLTEVKGLSKNHSLGIINNIRHESGFEFGAHNPDDLGKPSSGLFQHRGSRRDSLVEFAGGGDEWSKDWRTQIDYMMTENDTKKYLKKTFNTPDEASSWFTEFWERPDKAKKKAKDRLTTLPNIIDSVSKPVVYPNLLKEVTITPETQSEQYEQETTKNIQNLVNTYPPESYAPKFSTQVNMPSPLITQQRKGGYKTGDINEFATRYPKKKEMINTPFLENIQEFGDNISTIFKPKTYKKGHLTLRGKLNEPKIDIGWNPNLRTTPFGGPTFSKPSYSGNISADLRLRKNLSLYGNVNYNSAARPEYRAGLRFRFKRGGYKSKVCW